VVGRRLLPPTRLLRSGALTVDPILLRGATLGAGWRADRGGAAGSVYHAAAGALPIASGIPIVAAVLDLAPWAMPEAYQRGAAARFGQRIRARLLRDAAAVLVPGTATASEARRLLHVRKARLRVVPLAPRPAFRPEAAAGAAREAERLGLGPRYAVYAGRYDARQDLPTLLDALARLVDGPRDAAVGGGAGQWPPRVCLVGASPDDRAALSRAAARAGVADAMAYAPELPPERLAALVAGARFLVQPSRVESTGLVALEAIAAGVPVVASTAGVLPEVVGSAGILVEPGDPARLATALGAAWADDELHAQLVAAALERRATMRSWTDVAWDTRSAWSAVARPAPML
jgi:alpha-1,3-rhamnosyl/mannosyltransferase